MPLTDSDIAILRLLARYYVLTREQIQRVLFPDHTSGRSTRKRLAKLQRTGAIRKHRIPVVLPGQNGAAPVHYLTKDGTEVLASYFNDERYLACRTAHPRGDRLMHWIALGDTRIVIEAAIAAQEAVTLDGWINEWEVCDKDAAVESRFTLHTQLREDPPLSCSPDAAFLLEAQGHRKVFYVERDCGTSSPRQVAVRKHKGYAELARREGHRRHFPTATVPSFSVLVVTTNSYRVKQIGKHLQKCERPDLWLLACDLDLSAKTLLHGNVWHDADGKAAPLIKSPVTETASTTEVAS